MTTAAVETRVADLLGANANDLLSFTAKGFSKDALHLPGPDFVDRVVSSTDRPAPVLANFQRILNHGRLGGTGYVSIRPVDQGIEHSAGASFAPNPLYVDPENIAKLALEGGCNAVAWRGATGGEVVGFVSHVDTQTIQSARVAGIDQVLPRSRFVETLPDLLR